MLGAGGRHRAANLVVIPTRPAVFDLAAVQATVEIRPPHLAAMRASLP